jgi:hypothetical protein
VPPATLEAIDTPEFEGGRHDCMRRVGVCLASQGMSADQIATVFEHMYGDDRGVPVAEREQLAEWCSERPGEPCGGPSAVRRAKQAIRERGALVRVTTGSRSGPSRPPQENAIISAENGRKLLGKRLLSLDDLTDASPIKIHPQLEHRLAGFGLLCSHLYHSSDRIAVVSRAFCLDGDFEGNWRPSGYGETWPAGLWSRQINPKTAANHCGCIMPRDAKLTSNEKRPLDGSAPRKERGIPYLDPDDWWAATRWGAWFRYNPVATYEGSGKYGAHTDQDVARYPYLLVENDRLPLEMQISIIAAFGLPVAAVTSSGRRSLHMLVAVDAKNETHFRRMAARIYEKLAPYGFDHNGNPSRMTRMPGVFRRDELPNARQREEIAAAGKCPMLLGKQFLLWLSEDHQGMPLPW